MVWSYSDTLYAYSFFFFNDTATTEIYTLSLHDALPICALPPYAGGYRLPVIGRWRVHRTHYDRSEEHTSELQSRSDLVCRLLLEKKKLCLCAMLARNDTTEGAASTFHNIDVTRLPCPDR